MKFTKEDLTAEHVFSLRQLEAKTIETVNALTMDLAAIQEAHRGHQVVGLLRHIFGEELDDIYVNLDRTREFQEKLIDKIRHRHQYLNEIRHLLKYMSEQGHLGCDNDEFKREDTEDASS
jgi:hypothetical protein